jgi:hypothetical protein
MWCDYVGSILIGQDRGRWHAIVSKIIFRAHKRREFIDYLSDY